MQILFSNLQNKRFYLREIQNEYIENFIKGSQISSFESRFGELLKTKFTLATGNCTDSLFIILKTLGIQPNDEVLTPAFSCIPSSETISLCNAKPVFVDIDPNTYTIDRSFTLLSHW